MHRKVQCIHFVGIGGIGMSGIAEVLLNLGYTISGSDISRTDITQRLAEQGARIFQGHQASNLEIADVVVTSTAVKANNPEVIEAQKRNIPVIPRAEMLAELLKMKFSIAVSGSHGKTTTTSMIATVLFQGGLDPTMVIGGKLASIGSNAKLGDGEVIVAEADESDGSFLKLHPSLAVVTNIDREHLDHYRDIEEIKEAFLQFANIVPFYGATILCLDDPHVREILPSVKRRTVTYGLTPQADYRAEEIDYSGASTRFTLFCRGERLGRLTLNVPGRFNVYNALATAAVARELDMDLDAIEMGLAGFTGVHRRLEVKGQAGGVIVVDDYGHHPTEIRETLAAARQVWNGRIIAVFQPHRFTRTKALFEEFLGAFYDVDSLVLADIYPASEEPIPGIDSERLCQGIGRSGHGDVIYLPDFDGITDHLLAVAKPQDVIITLGAGNVWKIGEEFLRRKAGAAGPKAPEG
ncbi:MAG: UDP-N-acetylmuramate--L-alanine ligase [Deltaproteobacteria bacterium]|nr:UDP-N-acetylmuramate--L-alanine ligase [Deltaproteobacteria bacterium]